MSLEFDPSKYKNVAEMPKEEQENFEPVPTAPGDPEEFAMKSAVEKHARAMDDARYINELRSDIKKLFGLGKVSGVDVSHKEGIKDNYAFDIDKNINKERTLAIQEKAKKDIIFASSRSAEHFRTMRGEWIEAGVITKEDANQLPEVQEAAKKDIIFASNRNDEHYRTMRDEWVRAEVVDEATARVWAKK